MKEILEKLNNLVGVCETRIKKADSERSELASLRLNLNTQKEEQADTEEYLKEENAKLDKRNLIASTIAEAEVLKKKASEKSASLDADREALEKKIKVQEDRIRNENADLERRKEKLAKDVKILNQEKETYKDKMIREITKNIAKNKK